MKESNIRVIKYAALGVLALVTIIKPYLPAIKREMATARRTIHKVVTTPAPNDVGTNPINPTSEQLIKLNITVTAPEDIKLRLPHF
ncbi:MAG TPA: hypothetical protein DC064_01810 [Cyanobacteria bacterium UBA9273]|nr:hypothetical protein [Cyanobacteria bacterium UBA9273]